MTSWMGRTLETYCVFMEWLFEAAWLLLWALWQVAKAVADTIVVVTFLPFSSRD